MPRPGKIFEFFIFKWRVLVEFEALFYCPVQKPFTLFWACSLQFSTKYHLVFCNTKTCNCAITVIRWRIVSNTVQWRMGVFRGGLQGPRSPPPSIAPKNCRSTTTKDRLAALLLLQCQAYWIRKPDDSTSFSSVNELKEIAEVVLLI